MCKKVMKICIFGALFGASLASAKLIDGISVLVNSEPITLYEIHMLSRQEHIDLQKALNILIQKRLEVSQIKKLHINASDFEVSDEIGKIAKKNGMSKEGFLEMIERKGISVQEYKEDIKSELESKKLYSRIYSNNSISPTTEEMRAYYEKNIERFTKTKTFDVTMYKSSSIDSLKEKISSPMSIVSDVISQNIVLNANMLDRRSAYVLNITPVKSFTQPFKDEKGYVVYFINKKIGSVPVSFSEAKPLIQREFLKIYDRKKVDNYFNKLKADANIEVIRQP